MNTSGAPVVGRILNIQHFCVDDGPGIRTTVFLKGCPLRCVWCHNPESHVASDEIMYRADRCVGCGACASACPNGAHTFDVEGKHLFDRLLCTKCGKCTKACLVEALETVGESKTVDEVLSDVLSDRVFYETSNGGVTISGGEPTAQPAFTESFLTACKQEGLHTCVETCGWCKPENILALAPLVDLFLLDWKLTDDTLHKQYTGVSNTLIVENLARLCEIGARVILRCPLIPDINLTEDHLDGIAALANRFSSIEQIDLEPYHPMGIGKTNALGKVAAYTNDTFLESDRAEEAKAFIEKKVSIPVTVSGK
ncbi:MAG: glycyl-radical enzyme activating protein [Clostridia bacterium]|nr:glycyl-radical enzyme activating protein [Clostridia bacterium]